MYIYLCSRVAADARPLNDEVAATLRSAGHTVYVPHEQAPNNPADGRYNKELIFEMDFAAMNRADQCVAVGRLGRDCSWELGFFYAKNIPITYVPLDNSDHVTSPMLIPALIRQATLATLIATIP